MNIYNEILKGYNEVVTSFNMSPEETKEALEAQEMHDTSRAIQNSVKIEPAEVKEKTETKPTKSVKEFNITNLKEFWNKLDDVQKRSSIFVPLFSIALIITGIVLIPVIGPLGASLIFVGAAALIVDQYINVCLWNELMTESDESTNDSDKGDPNASVELEPVYQAKVPNTVTDGSKKVKELNQTPPNQVPSASSTLDQVYQSKS